VNLALKGAAARVDRAVIKWCIGIFLVALVPRLWLVIEVLAQVSELPTGRAERELIGFLTPDSEAYLAPARRLLAGDVLSAGTLTRPPGYPVFLALFGAAPSGVLVAQAILGSLIPMITFLLARAFGVRTGVAVAAGMIVAILPTGIGIVGLIGPDLLLAVLVSGGLLLLAVGMKTAASRVALLASATFAVAVLVKPVMVPWVPVSLVVAWMFARRPAPSPVWIALFLAIQLTPVLLWASRNELREGLFTYSTIGGNTARIYWLARAELMAVDPGGPAPQTLEQHQSELRERIFGAPMTAPDRQRLLKSESAGILRDHPGHAVRAFLLDIHENTSIGWDHFPRQLPSSPAASKRLARIAALEGRLFGAARWMLLAGPLLIWLISRRAAAGVRESVLPALGLALAASFFVVVSGVTFWTGPRMVFPGVAAGAALLALVTETAIAAATRPGGSSERAAPPESASRTLG
jgi:hypothetical protein